ncbi:MAG: hypothetical protein GY906_12725, partial [bacterium]|nr:hypothetical protein [bacterium]
MPDWGSYIRKNLSLPPMKGQREERIIQHLAEQLEDCYLEAIAHGAEEASAVAEAEDHIADWDRLAADISHAERQHLRARPDVWMDSAETTLRGKGGWWIVCADLALDTRQAIRSFLKTPAFVATTVLILALGIGVNTA